MPWSRCCALTAAVGWTATNSLVAATRTEAGVSTLLRVPRQPLLEDSPASGCCGLRVFAADTGHPAACAGSVRRPRPWHRLHGEPELGVVRGARARYRHRRLRYLLSSRRLGTAADGRQTAGKTASLRGGERSACFCDQRFDRSDLAVERLDIAQACRDRLCLLERQLERRATRRPPADPRGEARHRSSASAPAWRSGRPLSRHHRCRRGDRNSTFFL